MSGTSGLVLVLGSGRGIRALALQLVRSPLVGQVTCAPGSRGTQDPKNFLRREPNLAATNAAAIVRYVTGRNCRLVVIRREVTNLRRLKGALRKARIRFFNEDEVPEALDFLGAK